MKLETYLLVKSVIGGLGVIGAICWVVYVVREEVKAEEKWYKRYKGK